MNVCFCWCYEPFSFFLLSLRTALAPQCLGRPSALHPRQALLDGIDIYQMYGNDGAHPEFYDVMQNPRNFTLMMTNYNNFESPHVAKEGYRWIAKLYHQPRLWDHFHIVNSHQQVPASARAPPASRAVLTRHVREGVPTAQACGLVCLMHTGKPTGVAVCHCGAWSQTPLIHTACQIRYLSHSWDYRTTGQLCTLSLRGCLEYHPVSRVRQLILVFGIGAAASPLARQQ